MNFSPNYLTNYKNKNKKDSKEVLQITNTRIGNGTILGGSYNIPDAEYATVLKQYFKSVFVDGKPTNPEYLTETQRTIGPLLVDIDLRFSESVTKRQFTKTNVEQLLYQYVFEMEKIYSFGTKTDFMIHVFMKTDVNPVPEKHIVKDGIHILFGIKIENREVQKYIRNRIIQVLSDSNDVSLENWKNMGISNTWDSVFDEGITNGPTNWQLYGSRKPDYKPYILNTSYQVLFNKTTNKLELNETVFDVNENSIYQLSARYPNFPDYLYNANVPPNLFPTEQDDEEDETAITSRSKSNTSLIIRTQDQCDTYTIDHLLTIQNRDELKHMVDNWLLKLPYTSFNLKEIHDYTMLLTRDYYESGTYNKRMPVGWALRNISNQLFITWVYLISQREDFRFPLSIHEYWESWKAFDINRKDSLTERSIMYWAKQCNPVEYAKIQKNCVTHHIKEILKTPDCNDYQLATLLFHLYKDIYVCSSYTDKIWYYYRNHRWNYDGDGYNLICRISTELSGLFNEILLETIKQQQEAFRTEQIDISVETASDHGDNSGIKQKKAIDYITKINKIMKRLGETGQKTRIMSEARELFYDDKFTEKLNKQPYLYCFTNGVYDFKNDEFRDGRPDDYITMCCNNPYIPFDNITSSKKEVIDEINDFFEKIYPIVSVRNYMWELLALGLLGIPKQLFCMFIGGGANGKSLIMSLIAKAFGKYYVDVPISILTSTRTNVGAVSPEYQKMDGARWYSFQESSKGEVLNEGPMKQLSSGIEPVQYRGLYARQMQMFYPEGILTICSNNMLKLRSSDNGTNRRIKKIDQIALFCDNPVQGDPIQPYQYKKDEALIEKLDNWKVVFLSMIVNVCRKTRGKLSPCDEVEEASKKYIGEQDSISQFISECVIKTPNGKICKNELKPFFEMWYRELYDGLPPKMADVYEKMERIFGDSKKKPWKGISLVKTDTSEDAEDEHNYDE